MSEIEYTYVKGKGWVPRAAINNSRDFVSKGKTWRLTRCDECVPGVRSWKVRGRDLLELSESEFQDYVSQHWRWLSNPGIVCREVRSAGDSHYLYVLEIVS